jgi:aminoglycoside phosphotransferase (APT) family kinase protein
MIAKIQKNLDEMDLIGFDYRKKIGSLIERSHPLRAPKASHLVHGDFYVRHLLVDEEHRLAGVIDWGDVHIGDPAIDLAAAHSFLPLDAHAVFRKTYGNISEETWNLARLRAILSSTYIMLYGHHAKDPDLVREGIRSLNVMV